MIKGNAGIHKLCHIPSKPVAIIVPNGIKNAPKKYFCVNQTNFSSFRSRYLLFSNFSLFGGMNEKDLISLVIILLNLICLAFLKLFKDYFVYLYQ